MHQHGFTIGCAIVLREILTSAKGEIHFVCHGGLRIGEEETPTFEKPIRGPHSCDDAGVRVSPLLLNTRIFLCPVVVSGETYDSELTFDVRHLSV